ncbi:MAG: PKD domain-containing protein, partial [Thermoleophilaceae bacterium]
RWYELLPSSRTRRQQGRISTSGGDTYNAAISPAATGDVAMVHYNVSDPTLAPEIRARVRTPANGLGSLGPETTLGTSDASDAEASCTDPPFFTCRWGDYAGASPDHSRAGLVWGSNQAVGPTRTGIDTGQPAWKTRNFALGELAPQAGFAYRPSSPRVGQRVHFFSRASDPDGFVVSQSWDLNGNGLFGEATGPTASRVYRRPGPHTVSLLVTDNQGVRNVRTRIVARDRTRPRLRVRVKRRQRIRRVRRRRLGFFARSNESGRVFARLVISRRTARRLHLVSRRYRKRTYTIGRRSVRVRAHHRARVRVKLKRRVRRAIRHRRRVRVLLRVRARDQSGNYSRLVRRRVRLVR